MSRRHERFADRAALGLMGAMLPLLAAQAAAAAGASGSRIVGPGSSWVVAQTTHLANLTIGKGATVVAPAGESLTLTVDGVERDLKPGTYRGNVVLTLTRDMVVHYDCGPPCAGHPLPPEYFRSAIDVDGGHYVADESVASAVVGGRVTGREASGVSITSDGANFNGIIVDGDTHYVISHPRIDLSGNGANDFDGYASGIMASGHAKVLIDGAHITTQGVARGALYAGGHSTMTVNNSTIRVYNGKLPAGYKFTLQPGNMLEVPWMLGLTGDVRATLVTDYGTAYYNNDRIIAQGWGALSTDEVKRTRMYVSDSTIETLDSGYGSYSLGNSWNHFSHCKFRVADVALIMANGGSGTFTDGTVVDSRRFGVIMHSPAKRVGTLVIDKGSVFTTKSTVIEVKGVAANIVVDRATLHPGNGILLQAMVNDDPFAPPPPPGVDTPVVATLRHAVLRGDLINSRTTQGSLAVNLDATRLTGAISAATAVPITGAKPTEKTYYLIGAVKNTFGPPSGPYGLAVSVDGHSSWVVAKTSYLTQLTLSSGAKITAPHGDRLRMTVSGRAVPLTPGTYRGAIVLSVSPG